MNIDTIRYWHKLEHFYPYILEEQRDKNIKTYSVKYASDFPDYNNPDILPNKQVRYYEIYLGIFKVDSALKVLAERIHAEKEFRDESDETSCFCKIRVQADGTFNKEQFKVSSFPWAIHRVKDGGIDMEQWDEAFQEFQRTFFLRIFNCHRVLTYEILHDIIYEIKNSINWDIEFEECWMRIDRVVGDKIGDVTKQLDDVSEGDVNCKSEADIQLENKRVDELIKANDLLNSFYVRDLERVLEQIKDDNYGEALNSFVDHQSEQRIDIEKDKDELLKIFNPKYLPFGKWPNGYGLRGMQQVSVNLALSDLCTNSIFSVNGPPGTGKTTLLRDIIAAVEVERAIKLLELEIPDDAFMDSIGEFEHNGYKNLIKQLKPEFRKYGILVASNNNSAVRNITDELPLKKSINATYGESYMYFSEVSDRLFKEDTWGVLSATLGNYNNKMEFINNFWPIFESDDVDKFKFHKYLRGLKTERTQDERMIKWKNAKKAFEKVYDQAIVLYSDMGKCYEKILREKELEILLKRKKGDREILCNEEMQLKQSLEKIENLIQVKEKTLSRKENIKAELRRNTSFFWIKYFLGHSLSDYKELEREIRCIISEKNGIYEQLDKLQEQYANLDKKMKEFDNEYDDLLTEKEETRKFIQEWSNFYNATVPDEEYLANMIKEDGEERILAHNISPWCGEKIIDLRERLFLEAINLHKAFVENSLDIYDQLDAFNKLIRGMMPKAQAAVFATSLIQSFQMVVPVISSTFASIGTFLKYAGRNTFGLLLIDEAGQALPQSAVGAIWRADKSIIVGDPMQIEPVVTIHNKTIQFLKAYFGQTDFISSKETSVQSLADCCNQFGGWRLYDDLKMWIGSPLIVHGRCQRAIFDIANIIAYNKKMIYGTKNVEDAECKWEHVVGTATNKHYVPEQAGIISQQVVQAFYTAWEEGKDAPSLFIITPFRSVKAGLIQYFTDRDFLYYQIYQEDDEEKKRELKEWLYKNIGTIHTFQGKEANKVIIVLGVDSGDRGHGAVQWASQKPNILNVAATRAKTQLCIVGDKNKWAGQPNFEVAYRICCNKDLG